MACTSQLIQVRLGGCSSITGFGPNSWGAGTLPCQDTRRLTEVCKSQLTELLNLKCRRRMGQFSFYLLVPRHTPAYSLLANAALCCRFGPPLAFNFMAALAMPPSPHHSWRVRFVCFECCSALLQGCCLSAMAACCCVSRNWRASLLPPLARRFGCSACVNSKQILLVPFKCVTEYSHSTAVSHSKTARWSECQQCLPHSRQSSA